MCLLAARRGETKFHDPSRAIYLNSRVKHCGAVSAASGGGGFLLSGIGSAAGDRLANGSVTVRMSGSWHGNQQQPDQQPTVSDEEMEKLKLPTQHLEVMFKYC